VPAASGVELGRPVGLQLHPLEAPVTTPATTLRTAIGNAQRQADAGRLDLAWKHLGVAAAAVEEERRRIVGRLRGEGATWDQIATTLGMPKPTLHRRYRCVDDDDALVVDDDATLAVAWSVVPSQRTSTAPRTTTPAAADLSDDEWLERAMADLV
jgi:hypothetical protein